MGKVTDEVYNALRRRIMTGRLPPNAKVKELDVAAELGVSRTPVRSALQRLIADGLLQGGPKRGAVTVTWTDRDVAEIFELRAALEGIGASHAALHCSDEALEILIRLTDEMEDLWRRRPPDYLAHLQADNSRFHRLILEEGQCPRTRDLAFNLMDIPLVVGGFYLYSDADMARSIQHHRDITDAIAVGDSTWAGTAMRNHLMASHLVFVRLTQEKLPLDDVSRVEADSHSKSMPSGRGNGRSRED